MKENRIARTDYRLNELRCAGKRTDAWRRKNTNTQKRIRGLFPRNNFGERYICCHGVAMADRKNAHLSRAFEEQEPCNFTEIRVLK